MLNLFFGFQGRINRAKWWLAILIYVVAASLIIGLVLGVEEAVATPTLSANWIIAVLLYIPILISAIALGIKRLHDRNKSGWWLVLFYVVPYALQGIGTLMGEGIGMVLSLIGGAISIWALVELGILRGTIGANQYGPDPVPAAK